VAAIDNFCANLRAVLDDRDISQRDFAAKLGTKQPYISRLLNGGVDPGMNVCQRIADLLDIPLTLLLAEPEEFSKVRA